MRLTNQTKVSFVSLSNISKFQFDQESGRRRTTKWMCYLQIVIYLFNYPPCHLIVLSVLVFLTPSCDKKYTSPGF